MRFNVPFKEAILITCENCQPIFKEIVFLSKELIELKGKWINNQQIEPRIQLRSKWKGKRK